VTATLTNADPSAAPTTHHPVRTREQAVGRALAVVVGLLTIFGPISMDLYLPVLPALTTELQSATSTAQLTITAYLLGVALGQLIGIVAYVATSALCAFSPTIETLVAARFGRGLTGAVGILTTSSAASRLPTPDLGCPVCVVVPRCGRPDALPRPWRPAHGS
jgi:DHA1 family bicyclomycin/chloramphenicol resistance-like MFS transporter